MTMNLTDKPRFSFKEVVYIVSIIIGALFQQHSFEMEVHDAISEFAAEKQLKTEQVAQHDYQIKELYNKIDFLRNQMSPAIIPKKTQIESEL